MLFMSATDAMVVPSLKLLDIATLLTLIGTSRTIPVMVERISRIAQFRIPLGNAVLACDFEVVLRVL